jgi:hypothetical protein
VPLREAAAPAPTEPQPASIPEAEAELDIQVVASGAPVDHVVRSPRTSRALIGAALVVAFAVGLFFPRSQPDEPVRQPALSNVSQDVRIGSIARTSAGALRLERLTQRDDAFTAVVTIIEGFPDPELVTGAAVEVTTDGSLDARREFGVSDVELSRRPRGFVVRGELQPGAGRVIGLRLSSIQVAVAEVPEWIVDVSAVWPVRGTAPGVVHVGARRTAGAGNALRLVSVLTWRDRMEADLELIGAGSGDPGHFSVDTIELVARHNTETGQDRGRITLAAAQQEQISPSEILARFEGVPKETRRVTIRVSRLSHFLAGPWSWRLA